MELTKILALIEPESDNQPALDRARQLASLTGAAVELLIADFNPFLEDGYYFDPLQAQKLRYEHGEAHIKSLEKMAQPLRDAGVSVSVATAWGNPPYREVIRRIDETGASLVLKSTRHHSRISRLLLSNEDWELVRYCPVPLLLVKDRPWQEPPVFVAAVDPHHVHDKPAALDDKLIKTGQELARLSDGQFHLFHSAWVPPLAGVYPLVADATQETEILSELANRNGVDEEACHWSQDKIDESLPEFVEELKASVVIMGAVSRARLDRILIGNTAEKLLDDLECDVLVVKPDDMPAMNDILL